MPDYTSDASHIESIPPEPPFLPQPGPSKSRPRPIEVSCETCGSLFSKHLCHIKKNPRHFCSRPCYWASLNGHKQSDETREKRSAALSGDKGPNWKGGHSRQFKRGYKSEHFKHWRTAVFERDGYTCQGCGQHSGYLTAHHIKPFAKYPELRYEVSNGTTLCEPCHAEQDHYYARFHPTAKSGRV